MNESLRDRWRAGPHRPSPEAAVGHVRDHGPARGRRRRRDGWVRTADRPVRRHARGPPGLAARRDRAERRGQEHAPQAHRRPASSRRPGAWRSSAAHRARRRKLDRLPAPGRGGRLGVPGHRRRGRDDGPLRAARVRHAARPDRPRARRRGARDGRDGATRSTARSGRCRAASAGGSSWPARSPPTPTCTCSTSR